MATGARGKKSRRQQYKGKETMLHERLRDDPSEWGGLTQAQFASREKARMRDREKKRRRRNAERLRNESGRFVAKDRPPVPVPGKVWAVQSFNGLRAYTEDHERFFMQSMVNKVTPTRVSLPFISIQHSAA